MITALSSQNPTQQEKRACTLNETQAAREKQTRAAKCFTNRSQKRPLQAPGPTTFLGEEDAGTKTEQPSPAVPGWEPGLRHGSALP